MPSQYTPVGTINRLRASVTFSDPVSVQLNVTSNNLTPEGIRIALEGNATDLLPAMTTLIASPAPYLAVTVGIALIRPSALAAKFKTQLQKNTLLGLMTIYPDVRELDAFIVNNTALETVRDMDFSGREPSMVVTLRGYYQVNSAFY